MLCVWDGRWPSARAVRVKLSGADSAPGSTRKKYSCDLRVQSLGRWPLQRRDDFRGRPELPDAPGFENQYLVNMSNE